MSNGQAAMSIYGMMILVLLLIVVAILVQPILSIEDIAKAPVTGMDCANTSITTGTKYTCVAMDLFLPFFVISIFAAGAGYLYLTKREGV